MSILTVRQRGEWLVAGFNVGRLTDAGTVQRAAGELIAALETLPLRGKAALSFEGVEQASTQLASVLRAARALVVDDRFGRLVLCRVGANIAELLRLTGLDSAFEQYARLRDITTPASKTREFATTTATTASRSVGYVGDAEWID